MGDVRPIYSEYSHSLLVVRPSKTCPSIKTKHDAMSDDEAPKMMATCVGNPGSTFLRQWPRRNERTCRTRAGGANDGINGL